MRSILRIVATAAAFLIPLSAGAGVTSPTPTPSPTPYPCGTPIPPYVTPGPPLTPPPTPEQILPPGEYGGAVIHVPPGASIQLAADLARPGDRIVLNGASYTESVLLLTSGIRIESGIAGLVEWTGEEGFYILPGGDVDDVPDGLPPLTVIGATGVELAGLDLRGGDGFSCIGGGETCSSFGGGGGRGGAGLAARDGAEVKLLGCLLTGGVGGRGGSYDFAWDCNITMGWGSGRGGHGLEVSPDSRVGADPFCQFEGSGGGLSSWSTPWELSPSCCVFAVPHALPGIPVEDNGEPDAFSWIACDGPTPTPALSPTPAQTPAPQPTMAGDCMFPLDPVFESSGPVSAPSNLTGFSTAVSGPLLLVGAPWSESAGTRTGRAWVVETATGDPVAELIRQPHWRVPAFGSSVALEGNLAVVGDSVRVHAFQADTGARISTIHDPNHVRGSRFGHALALEGGVLYAGSPRMRYFGQIVGAVFALNVASALPVWETFSPDFEQLDEFGFSADASGALVLVGAPGSDAAGPADAGRAWILDAATGAPLRALEHPFPAAGNRFGAAVALDGGLALVGTDPGNAPGEAFIFNAADGTLLATLSPPGPVAGAGFGSAVAMRGGVIVAGERGAPFGSVREAGAMHVFDTSGLYQHTLRRSAPAAFDRFGGSVSVSDGVVAVGGAPLGDFGMDEDAGLFGVFACTAAASTPTATPTPVLSPTATPTPAATATPTPPGVSPTATAPHTPSPTAAPCCPGDADNSGSFVDANDFIAVQANFGADNGVGGPGDADCSGSFVDANDFIAVQANFGADCG